MESAVSLISDQPEPPIHSMYSGSSRGFGLESFAEVSGAAEAPPSGAGELPEERPGSSGGQSVQPAAVTAIKTAA
jgi:hypothetical protein